MVEKKFTSASDYKRKRRRSVEVSEGDVFIVRKMTPSIYGNALKSIGVTPNDFNPDGSLIDPEKVRSMINAGIFDVMKYVIPRCVVSPKIVPEPHQETDENILFDDIDETDLTTLLDEIYDFSGLSAEAKEERKEFLDDEPSEPREEDKSIVDTTV